MSQIIWNDDPGGNIEHIEEHGRSVEDVEYVLENDEILDVSHSSRRPCVFGYTLDGRYIVVVFEQIDDDTIYPVTAYDVPEP